MISHRHRCVYVKVPKCASTSVLAWFTAHGGGRPSFRPAWHGGPVSWQLPAVAHAMNLYPDYLTFSWPGGAVSSPNEVWLTRQRS